MRVLVIYCHPDEMSFASTLHAAVLEGLAMAGHTVTNLDLYGEGFKPVMTLDDRIAYGDLPRYYKSIEKYAGQLAAAEALVAVYPTWWYGMPAMLKGYFDRVWAPGVAFDIGFDGGSETDLLAHIRKLGVVTTYGSPWWLIRLYMGDPERKLWGRAIRKLCGKGCTLDWHAHYNMDHTTSARLEQFRGKVKQSFSQW